MVNIAHKFLSFVANLNQKAAWNYHFTNSTVSLAFFID